MAALLGPTVGTMVLTTTIASSLAPPSLFALARALGLARPASVVAGLALAALPIAVRFGGSADAFPMATTLLILGALGLTHAARSGGLWWVFAAAATGLAGSFRPACYALIPFLGLAPMLLARPGDRLRWLRDRWLWVALGLGSLIALPDVLPSLQTLDEGSALTVGWWSRPGIRSWPLVDPTATPGWFLPLAGAGALLAGVRRADLRPAVGWMTVLIGAMTFVYSSDNGWPASLRYAIAYGWVPCLFVAMGVSALPFRAPRAHLMAAAIAGLLVLSPIATHHAFMGQRSAQQEEWRLQEDEFLPLILAGDPGVVITPWLQAASAHRLRESLQRAASFWKPGLLKYNIHPPPNGTRNKNQYIPIGNTAPGS